MYNLGIADICTFALRTTHNAWLCCIRKPISVLWFNMSDPIGPNCLLRYFKVLARAAHVTNAQKFTTCMIQS